MLIFCAHDGVLIWTAANSLHSVRLPLTARQFAIWWQARTDVGSRPSLQFLYPLERDHSSDAVLREEMDTRDMHALMLTR
jgi:hypothetical protein